MSLVQSSNRAESMEPGARSESQQSVKPSTPREDKAPCPGNWEMGLLMFFVWAFVFHASLILERVTGQKTEKYGTQRCREGQDKEEYRRQ
jgi:hypothetical protein